MVGNLALKSNLNAIYTTSGAVTMGFDSTSTMRPADLIPVSAAGAVTVTLPPARLTTTALGAGNGQVIGFMNLAAQSLVIAATSPDTILGLSTTIAQNTTVSYVADAVNGRWFRLSA